ncbi:Hypothetical protein HVR_LOCUS657 [uncultured virus]|nr:Hypothetical protein HVR_LOCUS657 [uncultured virus]
MNDMLPGSTTIYTRLSSIEAFNNVVLSSADTALYMEITNFNINQFTGFADNIGIGIYRNSKGFLDNANGLATIDVGVNLQS